MAELSDWHGIWMKWQMEHVYEKNQKFVDLREDDELTDQNGYLLRRFIEAKWDKVIACYHEQQLAAEKYYRNILDGCRKVAAIDIGWAGSGALSLSHLVNKVWNMDCEIVGIIAGTNTIHNVEPDASDPFLQSGKLVSYLYSGADNRDFPYMFNISGRDAYAPMLVAASYNERYLKMIEKRFAFEITVN